MKVKSPPMLWLCFFVILALFPHFASADSSHTAGVCKKNINFDVVSYPRLLQQVDPGDVFSFTFGVPRGSICHRVPCRLEVTVPDGAVYLSDFASHSRNHTVAPKALKNFKKLYTWKLPVSRQTQKTAKYEVSFTTDLCAPPANLPFKFSVVAANNHKKIVASCSKSSQVCIHDELGY